jgi:tripartite-type tricarboxylate transporter receptor subunit TctC
MAWWALAWLCGAACAQPAFPNRLVTIVVPYPPGASADLLARLVQPRLIAGLGQQVLVDNRGGAGGNLGGSYVAKSPPDGYRILLATQPIIVSNPHLYKDIGYNPMTELVPVANAVTTVFSLVANPSLKVNNVAELIAYAKSHPKQLFYGSSGVGTPQHINGILLNQRAGIDMVHVPYKGGGPMVADLLAGHIQVGIATLSTVMPYVAEGKLKVLAIGEKTRYPAVPNIPTMSETLPGFVMTGWTGFFAPAGTPKEVIARLNEEIVKALRSPEVSRKLDELALPVVADTRPEDLAAITKQDYEVFGKVIRDAGITVE